MTLSTISTLVCGEIGPSNEGAYSLKAAIIWPTPSSSSGVSVLGQHLHSYASIRMMWRQYETLGDELEWNTYKFCSQQWRRDLDWCPWREFLRIGRHCDIWWLAYSMLLWKLSMVLLLGSWSSGWNLNRPSQYWWRLLFWLGICVGVGGMRLRCWRYQRGLFGWICWSLQGRLGGWFPCFGYQSINIF